MSSDLIIIFYNNNSSTVNRSKYFLEQNQKQKNIQRGRNGLNKLKKDQMSLRIFLHKLLSYLELIT
jgi:hypothetical protein